MILYLNGTQIVSVYNVHVNEVIVLLCNRKWKATLKGFIVDRVTIYGADIRCMCPSIQSIAL